MRAVVPGPAERELLAISEGVAAFAIDRLGCAGDRPVEWRQAKCHFGDEVYWTEIT